MNIHHSNNAHKGVSPIISVRHLTLRAYPNVFKPGWPSLNVSYCCESHMNVHTVKTLSYSLKCSSFTGLDSVLPVCVRRLISGRENGWLKCHKGHHRYLFHPVCSVAFPAAYHQWCDDSFVTVGKHQKPFSFIKNRCTTCKSCFKRGIQGSVYSSKGVLLKLQHHWLSL